MACDADITSPNGKFDSRMVWGSRCWKIHAEKAHVSYHITQSDFTQCKVDMGQCSERGCTQIKVDHLVKSDLRFDYDWSYDLFNSTYYTYDWEWAYESYGYDLAGWKESAVRDAGYDGDQARGAGYDEQASKSGVRDATYDGIEPHGTYDWPDWSYGWSGARSDWTYDLTYDRYALDRTYDWDATYDGVDFGSYDQVYDQVHNDYGGGRRSLTEWECQITITWESKSDFPLAVAYFFFVLTGLAALGVWIRYRKNPFASPQIWIFERGREGIHTPPSLELV